MKDKILCIIQARMDSSRLPGKMALDLGGRTVLERAGQRVSDAKKIDKIIVATTEKRADDRIEGIYQRMNINCFRGSEDDVLDRYYQAAKHFDFLHIARVTGDCPLIDPEIIDKVIELYKREKLEYATNVIPPTFPDGLDAEIFSFSALEKAWRAVELKSGREHVTVYMWRHPELFKQAHINSKKDLSAKRWTLDNSEDYEVIKKVYIDLYPDNPKFRLKDLLDFFQANPDIEEINQGIKRNEGLTKSLKEDNI